MAREKFQNNYFPISCLLTILCCFCSVDTSIGQTMPVSVYWGTYLNDPALGVNKFDKQDMAENVLADFYGGEENVYVIGRTNSIVGPSGVTNSCMLSPSYNSGNTYGYAYLAKFNSCGTLLWITYLGNDPITNPIIDGTSAVMLGTTHGCSEWAYSIAIDHQIISGQPTTYIFVGGEVMDGNDGINTLNAANCSGGAAPFKTTASDGWDGFIAKYNDNGTLNTWTYLGGTGPTCITCTGTCADADIVLGLTMDIQTHEVYATGYTESDNMHIGDGGAGPGTWNDLSYNGCGDCFIARFSNDLHSLNYFTYYGGSGTDRGHSIQFEYQKLIGKFIYVSGTSESSSGITFGSTGYQQSMSGTQDAFVLKWKTTNLTNTFGPTSPDWSTYVGGSLKERGRGLDISNGNVYETGWTNSTNLITATSTSNSANYWNKVYNHCMSGTDNDAYIIKLSSTGGDVWMTYFGGSLEERSNSLRFLKDGTNKYVIISGSTKSTDLGRHGTVDNCTTFSSSLPNNIQGSLAGQKDAFIAELTDFDPALTTQSLYFATYLGGTNDEFDVPSNGDIIFNSYGPSLDLSRADLTGHEAIYFAYSTKSTSMNFPVTKTVNPSNGGTGLEKGDAFLGKIIESGSGNPCSFEPRFADFDELHISSEDVSIYPNPSIDKVVLQINSNSPSDAAINLYDLNGKLIMHLKVTLVEGENQFPIDISTFGSGVYLCRILYPNQLIEKEIIRE